MTGSPILQVRIQQPIAEAEPIVRAALQQQGFGILTEVDVAATLRQKLGVETPPHKLLGACNPGIAHAALQADPNIGAFLPCGVAIRQGSTPGETIVTIQNPAIIAESFDAPGLEGPAADAMERLTNAIQALESA